MNCSSRFFIKYNIFQKIDRAKHFCFRFYHRVSINFFYMMQKYEVDLVTSEEKRYFSLFHPSQLLSQSSNLADLDLHGAVWTLLSVDSCYIDLLISWREIVSTWR